MSDTTNQSGLEDIPTFREDSGMTKIGNFDGLVIVQKDVVQFQVTMTNSLGMTVPYRTYDLTVEKSCNRLGHRLKTSYW